MGPNLWTLAIIAAVSAPLIAVGGQPTDARPYVTQHCMACHGEDGNTTLPQAPRLAGQMEDYLKSQLEDLRDRKRDDPLAMAFMYGPAGILDDTRIESLARYFSRQRPQQGDPVDPLVAVAGEHIFKDGFPNRGVPACAACHGQGGQGMAGFPRLAGQHADYLIKQLTAFKDGLRAYAPLMPDIAKKLSPEDVEAVSIYLSSQ